jgi:hypothetical protein
MVKFYVSQPMGETKTGSNPTFETYEEALEAAKTLSAKSNLTKTVVQVRTIISTKPVYTTTVEEVR